GGRRTGGDAEVTGRTTPAQSPEFVAAARLVAVAAFSACGAGPERAVGGAGGGAAGGPGTGGDATTLADPSEASEAGVRTGIDVLLEDSLHLVRGRRVGLITNHPGPVRAGRSSIGRLQDETEDEREAFSLTG